MPDAGQIKNEFEGSWVVVTGGSRGIGRSICYDFASKGANIVFLYRQDHAAAEETLQKTRDFGVKANKICVDVSDYESIQKTFSKIFDVCGSVAVLVNCVGINVDKTIGKLSFEDWNKVMSTNLTGCFNCTQIAISHMKERKYGRIISISSIIGQTGNIGQSNYAASKAAIIGFSKSIALETAKYDITVNVVSPGFIQTKMLEGIPLDVRQKIQEKIPKGRFGLPEEVAHVVSFLASPKLAYMTGQVIHINGGLHM